MEWLFAIGILVLLVVSPGFRALVFYGALGLGVLFWYNADQNDKEEEEKKAVVRTGELVYTQPFISDGKYHQRITNPTPHTITHLRIKLTFSECEKCPVIKEETVILLDDIPPGQARDIDSYVTGPLKSLNTPPAYTWNWMPQEVIAEKVVL